MSIEVVEKWDGRRQTRGSNPSQEVGFIIYGTDSDDAAHTAMLNYTPPTWNIAGEIDLPLIEGQITSRLAELIWEGTVKYGTTSGGGGGISNETSYGISFDTSGGRAKVTQSRNTTAYSNGTAPNFGGAIGVTKSGVEGVEVIVPALKFTLKRELPAEIVTPNYIKTLAYMTGKYNNATFATFEAGEVRFDGATGDQQTIGVPVTVNFNFTVEKNAVNLSTGGITVASKLGWQYLWLLYQEGEDTSAKALVQTAIAAYVEDLPNTEPVDFTLLGIGV